MKESQITEIFLRHWSLRCGHRDLSSGFTLVEMLVVMTVLVTVGSVILGIFVISLQGTSNSNNQQIARENGQYALTQVARQIKFAKAFNGVARNGNALTSDCTELDQNGDPRKYEEVEIIGFDDGITTFACIQNADNSYRLASQSASFESGETTNVSLMNSRSVKVRKCEFTCYQASISDPPTIGIHFELLYSEKNGSIQSFQTTVVPRNF